MEDKIRCIIIDDEELARMSLRIELEKIDNIDVICECSNGFEAVKEIRAHTPDMIFLDIQMPKLDGFDVLELVEDINPATVFVTAYDEHAIKAFEANAVDYLLKPVRQQRLFESINRVRELRNNSTQTGKLLSEVYEKRLPLTRLLIREGSDVIVLTVNEIVFLEAQDDYICVHTEKDKHLKTERLGKMEEMLDPGQFVRIHRSYIINISFIRKIKPYSKDSRQVILKNGKVLPVSKSGYKLLLQFL